MKSLKRILTAAVVTAAAIACTPKEKVLVLYYSQTGNTRAVAEKICSLTGADIEEITAVDPYSGTYEETINRCLRERESGALPEINQVESDLSQYDVIFLGYPVWFGTCARPVLTFLGEESLAGKKIVPFCTFGSGGLKSSTDDIKALQGASQVAPGFGIRAARMQAMEAELDRFLKERGYIAGEVVKLDEFGRMHPASEAEAAIFDEAVAGYRMISARASQVASRSIPGGTEYLFTAVDLPREGEEPADNPRTMQVYVTVADGAAPEFTQVVR